MQQWSRRPNPIKTAQIINWYTKDHLTCEEIGKRLSITRQAVARQLKKAGVSSYQGEHIVVKCAWCGGETIHHRARARKSVRLFCNKYCYYAARENPAYLQWRHGGNRARAVVARYFDLQPSHVVHHHDFDQGNNDPRNLAVFESQAHHTSFHHRIRPTRMLWDGRKLSFDS